MNGLKPVAAGVMLVVLAIVALPPLLPLEGYRDSVARSASERLGTAVGIAKLRLWLLPAPHFTAIDVTVGDADALALGTVVVRPRLATLFGDAPVLRAVEIRDLAADGAVVSRLAALARNRDSGERRLRIEQVVLTNARFTTPRGEIGPFDAEVALDPAGEPERATLRTADDRLRVELRPERDRYAVTVKAERWTLPWGPALAFERLEMKGAATLNEARFDHVDAHGYGGRASGTLSASWAEGMRISGELTVENVELAPLLKAFSRESRIAGRLDAKPVFRAHAARPGHLGRALRLQGQFQVRHAVVRGIDLQGAVGAATRGTQNGDTRLDELSGHLAVERGVYRFTRLKASSGALAAHGTLDIGEGQALSGRVYAQLQPLGAAADVPLDVGGTLDAPTLAPSGASIAGAAVGTAVLGPVLGTSIGAKLGDWAESLFSSKGRQAKAADEPE